MPSSAPLTDDAVASCSFCGKPGSKVQRLVAGPGVYICNECVELAAWVVEDAARATPEEASQRRSEFHHRSAEDILAALPALVGAADRVERELGAWIGRLRACGADWQAIAGAVGMSAEAARRRFDAPTEG
jgi:hypothetical protein